MIATRTIIGNKFESTECNKHGWIHHNACNRAKFRLSDAIAVRFNAKNLNEYPISPTTFVIKCDALDKKGIPVEIKRGTIVNDNGVKLSISFSEHLSIKSYRDVYKIICEKLKIPYTYSPIKQNGEKSKRKILTFDKLYAKQPEIIPLEKLKSLGIKRKRIYYRTLMEFCQTNGATEMFNNFVTSEAVQNIFDSWVQNFRYKNFYLDCQSKLYHSSDLIFHVKPVRGYWGFDRMTVFARLKKNV